MKTYMFGAALLAIAGMGLMSPRADAQRSHPRVHEVNGRLENQHDRIQQGVKSGELTRQEARRLRLQEAKIRYQERRDRAQHGGHLTKKETRRLNHELNNESRRIYHNKHDRQSR